MPADDFKSIVEHYFNLSNQNPNDIDLLLNLAWSYERVGRYDDAINAFEQAVGLESQNPHAHYGMGLSYVGLESVDKALGAFQTALDIAKESDDRSESAVFMWQIESFMRRLRA